MNNEGILYERARKTFLSTASELGGLAKILFFMLTVFYFVFVKQSNTMRLAIYYQRMLEQRSKDLMPDNVPRFDMFDKYMNWKFQVKLFCYKRCGSRCYKVCCR